MTTKTISTYVAAGYSLAPQYDTLHITSTGGVGGFGVQLHSSATLDNDGRIQATGGSNGVHAYAAATITNGSTTNTAASIQGYSGIFASGAPVTATNFGVVRGVGGFGDGVFAVDGGALTNGANGDTGAYIYGKNSGVSAGAAATVSNFATIVGVNGQGVYLQLGGSVTNGSSLDTIATIAGHSGQGVYAKSGAATVINFGAIESQQNGAVVLGDGGKVTNFGSIDSNAAQGVYLRAGGTIINGSTRNTSAVIEGLFAGVGSGAAGTLRNFGSIFAGSGVGGPVGVSFGGNASIINGSARDATALIEANTGLMVSYDAVVTNFGTILGTGGVAVQFGNASDVLVVEAGCAFIGQVLGDGGTLDLDSGVGVLTGLLAGGNVTVSGSMATTTFTNFGTVKIGAKASFTDTGAVSLAAGQAVIVSGALTLGGSNFAVVNSGKLETTGGILTVKGTVTGSGQATIRGGTLDFKSSFNQNVTFFAGVGTLELARSHTYTATITGFSKTGSTSLDLVDIGFVSAGEATYSGTSQGGVLTVTDGTHTAHIALKGDFRSSTFVAASDGHGGTIVTDPTPPATAPAPWVAPAMGQRFVAAMAGLGISASPTAYAREPWFGHEPMLATSRVAST